MGDTITITGNVASDPDQKRTERGISITTFRVASGQRRFDRRANAWVETGTNWYSVSAFRGLAEHAHASLRKGDRVIITGRLRIRDWENGSKRGTSIEIDADAIGHDLLWGTTAFTKTVRAHENQNEDAWPTPDEPSSPDWALPGAGREQVDAWSAPAPDTPQRELAEVETPF
jgi:single-strand DNA-binding protein